MMSMNAASASMYRMAKNAPLDGDMSSLLQVIATNPPMTKEKVLEQSPLGPTEATEALRRLYQKTLVVLDSHGKYHAVPEQGQTPFEARKRVIKKAFEMFGLFSAEGLAQYLHHSFGMRELRRSLRELEAENFLSRGYLRPSDDTLYWILASEVRKVGKIRFEDGFVLAPQDRLLVYLRDGWGIRHGDTGQYIIFDGTLPCGKFKAKVDKHDIEIWDFEGNDRASEILKKFYSKLGKSVQKEDNKRMSEWEIADFFEKTNVFIRDE